MRRIPLFLFLWLALFSLASCAVVTQRPSGPLVSKHSVRTYSSVPNTPRERAELHILLGTMAAEQGQPKASAEQFLEALNEVPNPGVAARATAMALAARDKPLALRAAEKWAALDPHEIAAHEIIVRLAVDGGNTALAVRQCQAIIALPNGKPDQRFELVATILGQERAHVDTVTSVMNELLAATPNNASAYQAGALLALRLKQETRARKLAYRALIIEPSSPRAALLLMGALIEQHQLAQADRVIRSLYRGHDKNGLRIGYARLLLQKRHMTRARKVLHQVLEKNPRSLKAFFLLGVIDFTQGRLTDSKKRFLAVDSANHHGDDSNVQYFLGRIAELQGHWMRAIARYRKVVSPGVAVNAKFREASILGHIGHLADAVAVLRQLDQTNPALLARVVAAESSILLNAGQPNTAIDLLNKALASRPNNPTFLYMRALAYERLGHVSAAERELTGLLKKNPNSPQLLNALGYILAVHNPSQLDRARHLVARALKMMPESPAIIDSMGWILYREGHPSQALPLLQKAYRRSRDPEIAAHLIAVLATLGDSMQARELLRKASNRNPHNAALRKAEINLGRPPIGR